MIKGYKRFYLTTSSFSTVTDPSWTRGSHFIPLIVRCLDYCREEHVVQKFSQKSDSSPTQSRMYRRWLGVAPRQVPETWTMLRLSFDKKHAQALNNDDNNNNSINKDYPIP